MSEPSRSIGRIVIAVEADDASELALELARHLSESVSPELMGLFIENAHLLDYSRSRLAREITRSGRERPLERTQLERQIRQLSAQARARFEQAASRLGLRHSFHVTRGEIAAELLQQAAEAEALVLGLAERAAPPDPWVRTVVERLIESDLPVLLFARPAWSQGHSIAVVVDTAEVPHASLKAAARLARHSASPLTVILTGDALADRRHAVERVSGAAKALGADVGDVIAVNAVTPAALERAMRFCRARLLVLPGGEPSSQTALVVELLRRLRSALMIVRE